MHIKFGVLISITYLHTDVF